jgi:transposase-like protein
MAQRKNFKMSIEERRKRYFSEEFKRRKVSEIERKLITVSELSREYEVSGVAIYQWIWKYSSMKKKKERMVVESECDTRKIIELQERIKELERIIGQKQLLIEFQDKVIDIAESEYKVDIKKKLGGKPSSGTGITEKNTHTE